MFIDVEIEKCGLPHGRLPLQTNSKEWQKLKTLLPSECASAMHDSCLPCEGLNKPSDVRLQRGASGRQTLFSHGVVIGPEKYGAKGDVGFLGVRGGRKHRDRNFDRGFSLRFGARSVAIETQHWLLSCPAANSRGAANVTLSVRRESTWSFKASERALKYAPDALHFYSSGQGDGALSMRRLAYAIGICRKLGYRASVNVRGESDRFLRTGTFLTQQIFMNVGVAIRCDTGALRDQPFEAKLDNRRRRSTGAKSRLKEILLQYARELVVSAELGELPPEIEIPGDLVSQLDGLRETLAVGSGLEFVTRRELLRQRVGVHQIDNLTSHPAYRRFSGPGGFLLVEPGYRARAGLETVLRPIVVRGYEKACMRLFRWRFPNAIWLEPIPLFQPRLGAYVYEDNVKTLQKLRDEHLIAVDHTTVHFGSVPDLDVLCRQSRCTLSTVFCSSYLHDDVCFEILDQLPDIRKEGKRIARAITNSWS